jgi:restriction endonuclease Mrr
VGRLAATLARLGEWVKGTALSRANLVRYHDSLRAYEAFLGQVRKKREDEQRRQREEQWKLERARQDQARKRQREQVETKRRLKEQEEARKKERAFWTSLDGSKFETELAQLLQRRGFHAARTGKSGDEGVDILVQCRGRRIIVQCKAYKTRVGPGTVRDLAGTLHHVKADEAWLVTTSSFSRGAISFAKDEPIRLLTIVDVLRDSFKCEDGHAGR